MYFIYFYFIDNTKKYELGGSSIQNNPITNPSFYYSYNKYLFPSRRNHSVEGIFERNSRSNTNLINSGNNMFK